MKRWDAPLMSLKVINNYTTTPCPEKKVPLYFFTITLPNPNRFSKFFNHHTQQLICNKEIIKYPTIIHPRRYTTL